MKIQMKIIAKGSSIGVLCKSGIGRQISSKSRAKKAQVEIHRLLLQTIRLDSLQRTLAQIAGN